MSKERQRRRAAAEAERHKPVAKKASGGPGGRATSVKVGGSTAAGSTASGSSAAGSAVAGAKQAAAQRTAAPKKARKGRPTVYRQRRFKPLPMALKAGLAVGWLAGAVAILLLTPTWTGRIGFLVILTMLLPLIVVLVRDPSRRTR